MVPTRNIKFFFLFFVYFLLFFFSSERLKKKSDIHRANQFNPFAMFIILRFAPRIYGDISSCWHSRYVSYSSAFSKRTGSFLRNTTIYSEAIHCSAGWETVCWAKGSFRDVDVLCKTCELPSEDARFSAVLSCLWNWLTYENVLFVMK